MKNMDLEKSRNGFYTVTFINRNKLEEKEILRQFSAAGRVYKIIQNKQRVFVRFKQKQEAENAILIFGPKYNAEMAKNNDKLCESSQQDAAGISQISSQKPPLLPTPPITNSTSTNMCNLQSSNDSSLQPALTLNPKSTSMDKLNNGFHLILGNLPKSYTIKDVNSLVEEAKPLCVNELEETRGFHVKFCHIVLDSSKNLDYLINKLDGFVISGEKLIAVEAKHLIEWRQKGV